MDLAHNALEVLNKRYFKKNDQGEIIEDWEGLCHRVTSHVMNIKDTNNPKYKAIYKMLHSRDFLPNSPTLFNAGISGTLSGCFFMRPEDSMISIMKVADHTAKILKFGGGVGFNFSSIRPLGTHIKTTHGMACGPLSVLETYSQIGDMVTQAGKRSAAYMGLMRIDHPDIIDFVNIKKKNPKLSNFNISVAVTDEFMTALHKGEDIELKFDGEVYGTVSAKSLWQMIISNAHKSGDPGLLFIDRVKEMDPLLKTLPIEGCNPCGEQVLENYGACTLGSINLYQMLDKNNKLSITKLRKTVYQAVEFLDSTIDQNKFPVPRVTQTVKLSRKIGLGVMGFADMLCAMGVVYGSDESMKIAKELMERIQFEALSASANLAQKKGSFPEFNYSDMKPIHIFRDRAINLYSEDNKQACYRAKERWDNLITQIETYGLRNATVTTIAPTGTIGIIADVSGGIEPHFSLVYKRRAFAGERDLYVVSRYLADISDEWELNEEDYNIIMKGDIKKCGKLSLNIQDTLVSANELSVEEHIGMLAAFQLFTSNAISKTINMPKTASIKDVSNAYLKGYTSGCKGITIYRDGSIKGQVLSTSEESEVDSGYLSAHRIKINTESGQAFILVSESEGKPVEIFMFPPDKSIQTDREGAYMEALCRIIAVGIQGYDKLNEYEKQLKKSNAKRGNPNPTLTYIKQALKSSKDVDSLLDLPMTDEDKVVIYSIYRSIKLGLSGCSDLNEYLKELKDVNTQHGHVSTTLNFIIRALVSVAEYLDDVGPSRLSAICDKCGSEMIPYENCFRCKECNHTKCG